MCSMHPEDETKKKKKMLEDECLFVCASGRRSRFIAIAVADRLNGAY